MDRSGELNRLIRVNRQQSLRRCSSAFTLIEMLVVLTIMGVLIGVATLSIDLADDTQRSEHEANRLVELLRLQCEESILLGTELGLSLEPASYHFVQWADQQWQDRIEHSNHLPRSLPDGFSFELVLNERAVELANEGNSQPHVICFSSGEMTPFELLLKPPGSQPGFRIIGRFDGALELQGWVDA